MPSERPNGGADDLNDETGAAVPLLEIPDRLLVPIAACAEFEWLEYSRMWLATVSGFDGLWAQGPSRDSASLELLDVLRSWISIGVWSQADLPLAAEVSAAAMS